MLIVKIDCLILKVFIQSIHFPSLIDLFIWLIFKIKDVQIDGHVTKRNFHRAISTVD